MLGLLLGTFILSFLASEAVPNRRPSDTASKIKAFIDEHRDADLVVCTGNTSVEGLAWLARQINDSRNVTLVIGDMTEHLFTKSKDEDRQVDPPHPGRALQVAGLFRCRSCLRVVRGFPF